MAKEVAQPLLLDGDAAWPEFAWQRNSDTFGLPVLPLLMRKGDATLTIQGPDVRDPRFYFVSNGIVLEESELADPACSRVLLSISFKPCRLMDLNGMVKSSFKASA